MKTAWVQVDDQDDKLWWSENCFHAAVGLTKLGWTVKRFKASNLYNLPLTKRTLVKGGVGIVRKALDIIGAPQPPNVDIPKSLKKHAHRETWKTTLGAIRKSHGAVFIKPLHVQKAFHAMLVTAYTTRKDILPGLPDSFKVLAQDPVSFDGEWRAYVLNRKILGVKGYSGPLYGERPKRSFFQQLIREYEDQPVAYAIDVGFIVRPGLVKIPSLVEVNEGFSLGNYGISRVDYARMVEARWKEMVKSV